MEAAAGVLWSAYAVVCTVGSVAAALSLHAWTRRANGVTGEPEAADDAAVALLTLFIALSLLALTLAGYALYRAYLAALR